MHKEREPVLRSSHDEEGVALVTWLKNGDWRAARRAIDPCRDWNKRSRLVQAAASVSGRPQWLDEWVNLQPQISASWLVRGEHGIRWAWEARGSGTGDTVSSDSAEVMRQRLRGAINDFRRAAELEPADPTPWARLLWCAIGLEMGLGKKKAAFKQARDRERFHLDAHESMLVCLSHKWGGSHELMFEFARRTCQRVPAGNPLHVLIADAHIEMWCWMARFEKNYDAARAYMADAQVVAELTGSWKKCFAEPFSSGTPDAVAIHNTYAFAFWMAGDHERARAELEAAANRVTAHPWQFLDEPVAAFKKAWKDCQRD